MTTDTTSTGAPPAEVAVLGTGIMGAAMARNLARAGFAVRAWNRTRAKAAPLSDDGIRVASSAAEAVEDADVLVTMLFDGEAVRDVLPEIGPAMRAGLAWMQSTTVGLDDLAGFGEFAEARRIHLIDAPVLGTRGPAEQGSLTVLAAAAPEVRDTVAPVFEAVGSRTIWAGADAAGGAATRLKLVCNSWVLAVTHGVAEAMALARGLGVDSADFLGAVAGGPLDMGYLRGKAAAIDEGDYTPAFAVATAEKDARLIVAAGAAAGVRMDVAEAGAERFRRAAEQGHGAEDMAASFFAAFAGEGQERSD